MKQYCKNHITLKKSYYFVIFREFLNRLTSSIRYKVKKCKKEKKKKEKEIKYKWILLHFINKEKLIAQLTIFLDRRMSPEKNLTNSFVGIFRDMNLLINNFLHNLVLLRMIIYLVNRKALFDDVFSNLLKKRKKKSDLFIGTVLW